MDFVLTLHSHLPWVLHHGRWPHGSDWLCEAMVDTYLPLVETLDLLAREGTPAPMTIGVTPVLAAQLSHPSLESELAAFLTQRLGACNEAEAGFAVSGEEHLIPLVRFWRERYARLGRLWGRLAGNGGVVGALRRHADAGWIELLSSAATHGFLPLLEREESIALQLAVGRAEHRRLFGREPAGCWLPECAYRPRGFWQPDPLAVAQPERPGIEEHLGKHGYRFFFIDAHLAEAGRPLGLYREAGWPERSHRAQGAPVPLADESPALVPARRSPYRAYQVAPRPGHRPVTALVRDPESTRQVWSRHGGFPGDGAYLEFHKLRYPGGLKFWRVTSPQSDLGLKEPYEPNTARARAFGHAAHLHWLLWRRAQTPHDADESVIVAPFDTELFGHWWFEGVDFLADLYRQVAHRGGPNPRTASAHLAAEPATAALGLVAGSWGANGDFSMWLNPETRWTWERLWPLERRFWAVAPAGLADPACHAVLAQAARELLLLQSSDWQFIISTGAAADYGAKRFLGHAEALEVLVSALGPDGRGRLPGATDHAERVRQRDDLFPDILNPLAEVLAR